MANLTINTLHSVAGEDNLLVAGAVGATAILAAAAYYYLGSANVEGEFPKLRGIQFFHAWKFVQRRFDFFQSNFKRSLGKNFSFDVVNHHVIALAGENARQSFYSDAHLNSIEGLKILKGTAPRLRAMDVAAGKSDELKLIFVNRKLNMLFSTARLQKYIPALLQDILGKMEKWEGGSKKGRIDPFLEINSIVFVTTARLVASDDLVKNPAHGRKLEDLFMTIENNASTISVLLPWFPSAAEKKRQAATTELFTLLYTHVEKRRRLALSTTDPIDVLIADGETNETIVGVMMAGFFAGTANTGFVAAWTIVYFGVYPEWEEKCRDEIRKLISKHVKSSASSATLQEKLSAIPIGAWEDELPIVDACTREALRILFAGNITVRRNLEEAKSINGQTVGQGDFITYPMADTHLNPEYYPEPRKYDPGRWLRPDPVPKAAYPFLGWGAGRHVCTGMRMAKLEIKLIFVAMLMKHQYKLVDKNGKFPDKFIIPDFNSTGPTYRRPLGGPCYLDFKEIVE